MNLTFITEQDRRAIFSSTLRAYLLDSFLHGKLSFLCRFGCEDTVSEGQFILGFQVIDYFLKLSIFLQFHLYVLKSLFACLHQNYQNINLELLAWHFLSFILYTKKIISHFEQVIFYSKKIIDFAKKCLSN